MIFLTISRLSFQLPISDDLQDRFAVRVQNRAGPSRTHAAFDLDAGAAAGAGRYLYADAAAAAGNRHIALKLERQITAASGGVYADAVSAGAAASCIRAARIARTLARVRVTDVLVQIQGPAPVAGSLGTGSAGRVFGIASAARRLRYRNIVGAQLFRRGCTCKAPAKTDQQTQDQKKRIRF